jgi:hypothetical protein
MNKHRKGCYGCRFLKDAEGYNMQWKIGSHIIDSRVRGWTCSNFLGKPVSARINQYYNRARFDDVVLDEDLAYEDFEAFLETYMVEPGWDEKEMLWHLYVENVREGCDMWRPRPPKQQWVKK